jgi:hypothetical protein
VTLRAALGHSFGRYAESTEAKVLYTERRPGGATVYMRIDGGTLIGPVLVRGGATMLALPFVSRGGHWLIENGAYLRAQANSYLAVRELYRKIKRESLREQAQEEEEDK